MLLAYGAFGFLSNALASRYVARSLRHTLLGATVLMAVTLLALPAATGLRGAVLALVALWGVAWGALPLALNMWHRQIRDIEDETVSAMFTLTTQVGIGCGTVLAGYIVDARGLGANYVTGAAVAALAVLVIVLLPVKGTVEAPVKRAESA
ncbi:MFS transporter [Paraburkholderia tropica]|uniref:MFS transporter n=1 Tax=Paraburkholderia tropica TaxID=92647 RepID=UPI0009B0C516|nr:MFS transporter [Paraburkholderia tropica]